MAILPSNAFCLWSIFGICMEKNEDIKCKIHIHIIFCSLFYYNNNIYISNCVLCCIILGTLLGTRGRFCVFNCQDIEPSIAFLSFHFILLCKSLFVSMQSFRRFLPNLKESVPDCLRGQVEDHIEQKFY